MYDSLALSNKVELEVKNQKLEKENQQLQKLSELLFGLCLDELNCVFLLDKIFSAKVSFYNHNNIFVLFIKALMNICLIKRKVLLFLSKSIQ